MARTELMAELEAESRRYLAAYVLFNQAVADKLRIHPTDLQCLNLLTIETGPFTVSQIAELTGLTSGSASRLVERLVKAGYVIREQDVQDRRRLVIRVHANALKPVRARWNALAKDWIESFGDYTDDELAVLVRHMRRTTELSRAQVERLRDRA